MNTLGKPSAGILLLLFFITFTATAQTNGIYADFETSAGVFTCVLDPVAAPRTVASFIGLTTGQRPWLNERSGCASTNAFYDGRHIDRVVSSKFILGGSADGAPGYPILGEGSSWSQFDSPGLLAMVSARTNSSQFLITLTNSAEGVDDCTIIGRVVAGMSVVQAIGESLVDSAGQPQQEILIRHVTIRRVGTDAEKFDIYEQGLPVVANTHLGVSVANGNVTFQFTSRPFVNSVLCSSTNLVDWRVRDLGLDLETPVLGTWTQPVDSHAEFFRMAQVTYPGSTLAPRSLAYQTLTLNLGATNPVVLSFDSYGRATITNLGAAIPIDYGWRQGTYEGWLSLSNVPGNPTLTLLLRFSNASAGTLLNLGGLEPANGTFTIADPTRPDGLEGSWQLNGDWRDSTRRHDLTPVTPGGFGLAPQLRPDNHGCYGPTKNSSGNGAASLSFTNVPEDRGVTMEGWVCLPDDSASGTLFGFGDNGWDRPKLSVTAGWGFVWIVIGQQNDGAVVQYPRIGDTCWHHLALVLPKGFRTEIPFRFYLDGIETTNINIDSSVTGSASLNQSARIFGSPFTIGNFNEGFIKIDEVRVWSRELSPSEIAEAARPLGAGALCENTPPPNWAPGPRFVPPTNEPPRALTLGVHLLTDDTIAVITDPNPFLKQRIIADCGLYLHAMETNRQFLPAWMPNFEYDLATWEVIVHYRTNIFNSLCSTNHFTLAVSGQTNNALTTLGLWPQATREFRTPSLADAGGDVHTFSSENVYYSYLQLPFHMEPGASYTVTDAWSNSVSWTYDEAKSISWALKVNQLGYLADAPEKYAYLGSWLGGAGGPLDLTRFDGKSFYVCNESDGQTVFAGTIAFRGDESLPVNGLILSGERVYQLDFSAFNSPGRYYIRVPGLGRSWGFEVGQNAMGEAFYTYLRSLYHQRCGTNLTSNYTAWARGDAHTNTWKDSYPSENDAWSDHSSQGWGLLDANGHFPTNFSNPFQVVQDTATTNLLPGVRGGWHDAGDYDREWSHLKVVEDLVETYLMFPGNFTDGQANIPESGNGIPDILDEATWGMEVWRRAQEPDGRVALTIEATSHPQIPDPNIDTEPYYLGLATHNSSILYSQHAARLSRALKQAGATNEAQTFLESAKRAYAFGTAGGPQISATIDDPDGVFFWKEPPQINPGEKSKALVQLWLASGDTNYFAALTSPEGFTAYKQEVDSLYWRTYSIDFIDVALASDQFPPEWGSLVTNAIVSNAENWVRWQKAHAYRKLWYAPGEGYFPLMGWGNNGFLYIRNLVVAWRMTGDSRYRSAALTAVDWMHGANPQGRVNATGLGHNNVVNPLHDPSDTDGIDDPVPGINLYAYTSGIVYNARTEIFGLFADPIPTEAFDGVSIAEVPPPWNDPGMSPQQVGDLLYSKVPLWRSLWALEAANPPQMEFTVTETQGPAVAVTGCLLGPGWRPSASLLNRKPRTPEQLRDSLWFHP